MYARYALRLLVRHRLALLSAIFLLAFVQLGLQLTGDQSLPPPQPPLQVDGEISLLLPSQSLVGPRLERELNSGLNTCPDLRRPLANQVRTRNGAWQYHENRTSEIVVYAAFFDDRPALGLSTWIRVLGVARLPSTEVYCQMWYEKHQMPFVTRSQVNLTGRKAGYNDGNNATYRQYLFSCPLPGVEPVPSHVSLVTSQCGASTICLPVERPVKAAPDQEFGVCVAVSFGSIPAVEFVEWMELNRMFGVTEFNVYDANMTNMSAVFDNYVRKGVLRVLRLPPAIDLSTLDGVKLGSAVSLNDCMMRNVYRYGTVIVIDFDEVIVPRMHSTYTAMLNHIDKANKLTERYSGYAFRNAYFFQDSKPDPSQPKYLRTAAYRVRSDVKRYPVAPKSFLDPRRCLSVFNHYCLIPIRTDVKPRHLEVHPSLAVTHHYRRCGYSAAVCKEHFNSSFRDDTALRFKVDLQRRVDVVLKELMVFSNGSRTG